MVILPELLIQIIAYFNADILELLRKHQLSYV